MAYEKFISARGGQGKTFPAPYVTVNKGGMSFNRHAKEMIGDGFKFVVFFFDKQASKIGFWFWKDVCPGSYALIWHKSRKHFTVNGKSFYKAYGILEKIEKCDTGISRSSRIRKASRTMTSIASGLSHLREDSNHCLKEVKLGYGL